jgi:hypothetical protein
MSEDNAPLAAPFRPRRVMGAASSLGVGVVFVETLLNLSLILSAGFDGLFVVLCTGGCEGDEERDFSGVVTNN